MEYKSRLLNNAEALKRSQPLRVVLLNDIGFVGGAGRATWRQAQSLMSGGHHVSVVCCLRNLSTPRIQTHKKSLEMNWGGLHAIPTALCRPGQLPEKRLKIVLNEVARHRPDVVIAGNLHSAGWPVQLLREVRDQLKIPVIAYAHDAHWVTGRCAYAGQCQKYLTGCDEACPTADEYPSLTPKLIHSAWRDRAEVFAGTDPIPVATNSNWMTELFKSRFGSVAITRTLYLGIDHNLFNPIDQGVARRMLGLMEGIPVVLAGAIDIGESRKGGPLLMEIIKELQSLHRVAIVAFGQNSWCIDGVTGLGYLDDERIMPLVYSASDTMLHVAQEEAFGQTLLEASACGIPSVARSTGGVPEVVTHDQTGVLVPRDRPEDYVHEIMRLIDDPPRRQNLGTAARDYAVRTFSLEAQHDRWSQFLVDLAETSTAKEQAATFVKPVSGAATP